MEISFDPRKNTLNIANHGYDFAAITVEFFISATILDARAGRFNAIGEFEGKVVSIIFKPLGTQGALGDFHASCQQEGKGDL